ncbi:MAG: phosphoribosylformylglycinamidine synthase subunit PurL [Alphaproteobacteria bacterium]|nr:phosphoribosylformylglycinamidine synthase subunit PurL [Alphaproteobacteria bacterium]
MTNIAQEQNNSPLPPEPEVTAELGAEFGLNDKEYNQVLEILGRQPTFTELGIFSVMWSEHCSYKSSRLHLKKLPTEAPWVIQGPGENAGVIDIEDGQAAVFKMESHNHPSYIEPYQGATTGVGGIMRDVFTMGARPIANMNALRFGDPSHPKTRHLVDGVVAGIAGYGNCMGVPTVGGETDFHKSYNGNILVNAMCVGLAEQDKIYYATGAKPDMPIVYIGAKTGRDGIHGATMASAEFEEGIEGNRPTVQVGDPFTEKLLLEACLELMQEDDIVSIQDMGAAGLTSSAVEIADKGGIGVILELDDVPQRETLMSPYELMLSESQERMLMILKPGSEAKAKAIFDKWDLDFAVIGRTTDDKHLRLNMYGERWCDIPVPPLVDESPIYDRPQGDAPKPTPLSDAGYPLPDDGLMGALKTILSCPDMASKRWIWEQYDSLVMGETTASSGIVGTLTGTAADAAIVRIPNHKKALAITTDCTPRYCFANPFEGGKQAVAESYRNISATGATPLAITNNLNFGNPERPEIMAQFVGSIEGIGAAAKELDYPVVSGNVSLYNETSGEAILPTPVIGGVGLIKDEAKSMGMAFKSKGETIFLIGTNGSDLGQSIYLREVHNTEAGDAPHVDLAKEKQNGAFIRMVIDKELLTACHDISDGGLLVAVAEMGMASGKFGATLSTQGDETLYFAEDQARYVVTTNDTTSFQELCTQNNIQCQEIGCTNAGTLNVNGQEETIANLITLNEEWLENYMTGES